MLRSPTLALVPLLLVAGAWSAIGQPDPAPARAPAPLLEVPPGPDPGLHVRTFGRMGDPLVVYLHGGPGHNAALFEAAGAEVLAAAGFRVVVYDRRGCGRSKDVPAAYTFAEVLGDLARVVDGQGARRAALLGHSWGGVVGATFAAAYPENVSHLVLLGAPVSHQRMSRSILRSCRAVLAEHDPDQLVWIDRIEALDPTSLQTNGYVFMRAMACKLYEPATRTAAAQAIVDGLRQHEDRALFGDMTREPVAGFQASARYTTIDTTPDLRAAMDAGVPVSGIYGDEDGLFDAEERGRIGALLGAERMHVLQGASHNAFIDQREAFVALVRSLLSE